MKITGKLGMQFTKFAFLMTSLFSREITITDLCCIYVRICSGQLISMHHYLYDNEGQGVSNFGEDTQNNYIVHTIKKIMMLMIRLQRCFEIP